MEKYSDWKERSQISIGIPYLNEESFQTSYKLLTEEGFAVQVLSPNMVTRKLDYYHIPDFEGFDTLGMGFHYQSVKQHYKPTSNEVRYLIDEIMPKYVEADVKILVMGHSFFAATARIKNQKNSEFSKFPHLLKVDDKGNIDFRDEIIHPIYNHNHLRYVNTKEYLGCSQFYLDSYFLGLIEEGIKKEEKKELLGIV